jgi:hypothetical protein
MEQGVHEIGRRLGPEPENERACCVADGGRGCKRGAGFDCGIHGNSFAFPVEVDANHGEQRAKRALLRDASGSQRWMRAERV